MNPRKQLKLATVVAVAAGLLLSGPAPARAEAAGAVVSVPGGSLNVRSGPATDQRIVGTLEDGANPTVACKVRGERISGAVRSSSTWLRIGSDRWISHAYIDWTSKPHLRWCAAATQKPTAAEVDTGGGALNIRSVADSGGDRLGTYDHGEEILVRCQVWGQEVDGKVDKTHTWYRVGDGRHVSAGYVDWTAGEPWLPWCGQDAPTVPRGGSGSFIAQQAPAAQASQRSTGVPASVTLAQAILESGWGKSALAREDHNIFGMKCFGSPGANAIGCRDYATFECSPIGGCFDMDATFRVYDNVRDSYRDHGELLSEWSRYATAMTHRHDPDRFAREIHRAGYATDPHYSDKLIGIMQKYELYEYDGSHLS